MCRPRGGLAEVLRDLGRSEAWRTGVLVLRGRVRRAGLDHFRCWRPGTPGRNGSGHRSHRRSKRRVSSRPSPGGTPRSRTRCGVLVAGGPPIRGGGVRPIGGSGPTRRCRFPGLSFCPAQTVHRGGAPGVRAPRGRWRGPLVGPNDLYPSPESGRRTGINAVDHGQRMGRWRPVLYRLPAPPERDLVIGRDPRSAHNTGRSLWGRHRTGRDAHGDVRARRRPCRRHRAQGRAASVCVVGRCDGRFLHGIQIPGRRVRPRLGIDPLGRPGLAAPRGDFLRRGIVGGNPMVRLELVPFRRPRVSPAVRVGRLHESRILGSIPCRFSERRILRSRNGGLSQSALASPLPVLGNLDG